MRLLLKPGRYEWDVDDAEGGFIQAQYLQIGAAVAPAVPDPAAGKAVSRSILTPGGLLGMRRGMTVRQAHRASHRSVRRSRGGSNGTCSYARFAKQRIGLMLSRGRVVRFDLEPRSRVVALGGIRVGDPETKVREVFGAAVKTTDHVYNAPGGHYLDVPFYAGRYRGRLLRFATGADGRVQQIVAGSPAHVRLVEGCS